jgi:catechol 2,3-dioxygenase-like lactoylglutathione lyase family enzyme
MKLAAVTFLVRDYDEAIAWFVDVLQFRLLEDTTLTDTKRWVLVQSGEYGACLLLAKADGHLQDAALGKAAGGRVAYFLHTQDFDKSYEHMQAKGVKFQESPRNESYGKVCVFEDLYGNLWDLIEPSTFGSQV